MFDLFRNYRVQAGVIMSNESISPVESFRARLKSSLNIKEVPAPFSYMYYPQEIPTYEPCPDIKEAYRVADVADFLKKGVAFTKDEWSTIWSYSKLPLKPTMEVPKLAHLCAAQLSKYNLAFVSDHGRRPVYSAMSGLYPDKVVNTLMKLSRDPGMPPDITEITPYLDEAMEWFSHSMGLRHLWGTLDPRIQLDTLDGMYLGSANGKMPGAKRVIITEDGDKVEVNPSGKKYENMQATVTAVKGFLRDGKRFIVTWTNLLKDEHKFLPMYKPVVPIDKWTAMASKLRIVMIANSPFVFLERVCTRTRQFLERGWVIRIGQCWSHGGMDFIARCLNAYDDPDSVEVWEADFEGLDLSIKDKLIEIYWAYNMVYFDPKKPGYDKLKECVRFACEESINRLTAIFYDIWVIIRGLVPSGLWNTSHMDSFIVGLLFFWFICFQVRSKREGGTLTKEQRKEVHGFLIARLIALIVYGDDNLCSFKKGSWLIGLLNYYEWDKWLMRFFGMRLRDIRRGSFLSTVKDGIIVKRGATFLRHQAVVNPYVHLAGQPKYLPFRETQEVVLRLGWGKAPKIGRDLLDLALSVVGHAWGTYASNRETYDWLKCIFEHIVTKTKLTPNSLVARAFARTTEDDIRQMRHKGLDPEVLLTGFPAWQSLIKQNTVDPKKEFFTKLYL